MGGNPIPTVAREKVDARDRHRCVRCGMPAQDKHHRRRRRENHDGKAHSPSNLITLCGRGNTSGCHGWVHQHPVEARALGYTLRPDQDPDVESMQYVRKGRVRLDSQGSFTLVT